MEKFTFLRRVSEKWGAPAPLAPSILPPMPKYPKTVTLNSKQIIGWVFFNSNNGIKRILIRIFEYLFEP